MTRTHTVTVSPLPEWIDPTQYLGFGPWLCTTDTNGIVAQKELTTAQAADVAARLRGLGLNDRPLEVSCHPPLGRKAVREGRTIDARRRRKTTPGFTRRNCKSDAPSRVGLTPESIALKMAKGLNGCIIFDACGGIGGNAIGFARNGATVHTTEIDPNRISMAKQNARCFGVTQKITFHCIDARTFRQSPLDICFVDPPWGTDWDKKSCVLSDFPLAEALWTQFQKQQNWHAFWLKAPSSFVPKSLHRTAQVRPIFGEEDGDRQRIKFLLIKVTRHALDTLPE